eukprot:TRINITY_DN29953_c0_g2_i2.p1 TRINITY_DN29953_c0_g2~~TRINITY_DN29953_c0_g2_i2.p1  ORF type:complete len:331 (+),score=63.79 TRINITY_DN29953_c0_g2_i2:629-1621(+)
MPWLVIGLFVSGALQAITPSGETVAKLIGSGGVVDVVKGAVIGTFVPLCSCGALPVAMSLAEAGAAPAAVVSFITAAQSAGVDSALITYGVLGAPVAVARLLASLFMAIAAGLATPQSGHVAPAACCGKDHSAEKERPGFLMRVVKGVKQSLTDDFDEVAPWVAAGLVCTAAITTFAPTEGISFGDHPLGRAAVLVATLPLQLCEHGTVTFAHALRNAGATQGTAFAFLVSAPATNLATMALLMKRQPQGSLGVVRIASALTASALSVSYAFDASGVQFVDMKPGHDLPPWLTTASLYMAALLVVGSLVRRITGHGHAHSDGKEVHAHSD